MRRFTTLLLSFVLVAGVYGQKECTFMKATVAPEIGSDIDVVWDESNVYDIDVPYLGNDQPASNEVVTLPGGATFKGLWDAAGIYILCEVGDDVFYPWYAPDPDGADKWQYDKPEFYFDVNYELMDAAGSTDDGANGHWQIAPDIQEGVTDGTPIEESTGLVWAIMDNADGTYWVEYFIPMNMMKDADGFAMAMTRDVGFDAYIIDNDDVAGGSQQRIVWAGDGSVDQAWANMDNSGLVIFDGAAVGEYVTDITITGEDVTDNNGMMKIGVEVLPAEATTKDVTWFIDEDNSTGRATISADGVLTAVMDGDVMLYAMAIDGSWAESNILTVNITNQIVSRPEINMIRNGYFKDLNEDGTPAEWNIWGEPTIEDGVYSVTPERGDEGNIYDFRLQQRGPWGINTEDAYTLSFRLWADDVDTLNVDFEDAQGDYVRYGTSTHEYSAGTSDWTFMTETEPTKYEFDIEFADWTEDLNEQFHFMFGHCEPTVHLDSVEMFNNADLGLVDEYIEITDITVSGEDALDIGATAQMSAALLPADADYPSVKWSVVNGTGWATIDSDGMLSADSAGVVTVVALAYDDSGVEGVLDVTIGSTGISQKEVSTLKVYPNPAVNELTVELETGDGTVSIYNSVGQKMDQVVVSGNMYKFDISSYAAGIYFVKTETSVAKFIK